MSIGERLRPILRRPYSLTDFGPRRWIVKASPLPPEPEPGDESNLAVGFVFFAGQILGFAEASQPGDANVGRELAPNLVAEADAEIHPVDAGSGIEPFVALDGKLPFEAGLKDEFLSQQNVEADGQRTGHFALIADVDRGLDVEEVGGKFLKIAQFFGLGAEVLPVRKVVTYAGWEVFAAVNPARAS